MFLLQSICFYKSKHVSFTHFSMYQFHSHLSFPTLWALQTLQLNCLLDISVSHPPLDFWEGPFTNNAFPCLILFAHIHNPIKHSFFVIVTQVSVLWLGIKLRVCRLKSNTFHLVISGVLFRRYWQVSHANGYFAYADSLRSNGPSRDCHFCIYLELVN